MPNAGLLHYITKLAQARKSLAAIDEAIAMRDQACRNYAVEMLLFLVCNEVFHHNHTE